MAYLYIFLPMRKYTTVHTQNNGLIVLTFEKFTFGHGLKMSSGAAASLSPSPDDTYAFQRTAIYTYSVCSRKIPRRAVFGENYTYGGVSVRPRHPGVTQYLYENINVVRGLENDNLYPRPIRFR